METASSISFVNMPYELLQRCVEHPYLNVQSYSFLAEAMLVWLDSNKARGQCSDGQLRILNQVRLNLLPLDFTAGERKNSCFSNLAEQSITAVINMIKCSPTRHTFNDAKLSNLKIRLIGCAEKVDVSGCPQMTLSALLFSLMPSLPSMGPTIAAEIEACIADVTKSNMISKFPTSAFLAVQEVDISRCPRLYLEAAIECFSKSFPSLRRLTVSHYFEFKMRSLFHLVKKCPLVEEIDISVDVGPATPNLKPVQQSMDVVADVSGSSFLRPGELLFSSNLKKLKLESRWDLTDSSLLCISAFYTSLSSLSLKGCTALTDARIATIISKCCKLRYLDLSHTKFGKLSILALVSDGVPLAEEIGYSRSLAFSLEELSIEGTGGDAESIKLLMSATFSVRVMNLSKTYLDENALDEFLGSFLTNLDISDTKVSGVSLTRIIQRNPNLRILLARGCENLEGYDQLNKELCRNGLLEELSIGRRFGANSVEFLGPSIKALAVGRGASLDEQDLMKLPNICPSLKSLRLSDQVLLGNLIIGLLSSLTSLEILSLGYCNGELTPAIFCSSLASIKVLNLEKVAPRMTNDDLDNLTQTCKSLVELSLTGCPELNIDSQRIIACGWPCLRTLHLEECGSITSEGVSWLYTCKALEDLLLRHNGCGLLSDFIPVASSELPMLRKVALDLCDSKHYNFNIHGFARDSMVSIVTVTKCSAEACRGKAVHEVTMVMEYSSNGSKSTTLKGRV
ncbi:BTB/POZ domain-containing protein FBL11-like [Papaver somniferum]|uniref:BTB/POZ domain-containing protein FBL11-like n=1 Tax=Papaver somniferum TaxID=3469 RepID=UPI000E6FF7C4|nr:BTB/POZ domain-containing protein FBL11-like [Papaver somniferum]